MPRVYPKKTVKFCFTWNLPDGYNIDSAQDLMLVELQANQRVVYGVFQQEEGTHKHLQGCFRLEPSCSRSCDWVRETFPMLAHATVSCCNNWSASVKYCQKEDTRIAGSTPSIFGDVGAVEGSEKYGTSWDHYWGSFYYDDLYCRELM